MVDEYTSEKYLTRVNRQKSSCKVFKIVPGQKRRQVVLDIVFKDIWIPSCFDWTFESALGPSALGGPNVIEGINLLLRIGTSRYVHIGQDIIEFNFKAKHVFYFVHLISGHAFPFVLFSDKGPEGPSGPSAPIGISLSRLVQYQMEKDFFLEMSVHSSGRLVATADSRLALQKKLDTLEEQEFEFKYLDFGHGRDPEESS